VDNMLNKFDINKIVALKNKSKCLTIMTIGNK